ncbi:MAG: hypothetical protein R6V03_03030 [Kiritimatiellia bacterium]
MTILRRIITGLVLTGVFAATGCIDHTTLIVVKKDGSGMVMETTYLGKAFTDMIQQMSAGMGGQPADPFAEMMKPDQYRNKASKMGEGVKYVKASKVQKGALLGVKVVYAFDDITKLKVTTEPENPGGGMQMGAGQDKDQEKSKPIKFGFQKGGTSRLTVNMPFEIPEGKPKEGAAAPARQTVPAQQMEMMKQMFQDFRMRMMVKVDGDIRKTNASYVFKGSKSGKKQYVTLIDMEFGKLLDDPEILNKLAARGQDAGMEDMVELLKDIPGLKFETLPEIEIEFK